MLKSLYIGVASLVICAHADATPSHFDEACSDNPATVILLDTTSQRRADEERKANFFLTSLKKSQSGQKIAVYLDKGKGYAENTFLGCSPRICSKQHVILRRISGDSRVCTKQGFEDAYEKFQYDLETAFQPYFEKSSSPSSDLFGGLKSVADHLRMNKIYQGKIYAFSDGLIYTDYAKYSPNAPWLTKPEAREHLFSKIALRDLMPNLRGFSVKWLFANRPLSDASRSSGAYLTPKQANNLTHFLNAVLLRTGADNAPESKEQDS